MHDIICPHCKKAFKVDETGYADILRQVRDEAFETQVHERLELAEREKHAAIELAQARLAGELQKNVAAKDAEIQALKGRLEAGDVARQLAVADALKEVEKERDTLAAQLGQLKQEQVSAAVLAESRLANELQQVAAGKDALIQELQAKLGTADVERALAINQAVGAIEKERNELKNGVERAELEKQLVEKSLKDKYESQLKDREEQIERLRDRATNPYPHSYPFVNIPHAYAEGMDLVLVNGVVVIDEGRHTGELPGRVLRHHGR